MTSQQYEALREAGVDVATALERFMGNETLLLRFLGKFPADPNHEKLVEAFAARDAEAALAASHALKGVCGNLSLTALFRLFEEQVALLRAGDFDGAAGLLSHIEPLYRTTVAGIHSALEIPA